jgi:hypothetical protein
MAHWMRQGTMWVAAAGLVGATLGAPSKVEARDRDDGFVRVHHGFRPYFGVNYGPWGAYGWGPYWGVGWGPGWWGPGWGYPNYPEGGVSMHAALMAGYGAIKVDAKPKQAEVWADGRPIAEARDLDGTPSYLWLKDGEHRIQVYQGGFVTFDQKVDVHAGMLTRLRIQLEPGASVPPTRAPEAG